MFRALKVRLHQGYKTIKFPKKPPVLPENFQGIPEVDDSKCTGCNQCIEVCPTGAISLTPGGLRLDLSRCIFCEECSRTCEPAAVAFTRNYRIGANRKEGLIVQGQYQNRIEKLNREMLRVFGHSMKFRVVSAGGCNACEADINVLGTIGFDLGRFGISYAASPRHADGLLITGPVSKNMEEALRKTYEAIPSPKIVVAVGTCAVSGGIYRDSPDVCNGADAVVPVDLYIPGCPPNPITILNGLLSLLGRVKEDS